MEPRHLRAAVHGLLVAQQEAVAICCAHTQLSLQQPAWKLVDPLKGSIVCWTDGEHQALRLGQVLQTQVQQPPGMQGMQGMGSSRLLLHNGQRVLLSQLEVESPFQTGAAAGLGAAVEQLGAEGHSLDDAVACMTTMVKLAELHEAAGALQLVQCPTTTPPEQPGPLVQRNMRGPCSSPGGMVHDGVAQTSTSSPAAVTSSPMTRSISPAAQMLRPPQHCNLPTALLNALAAEWRYAQQQAASTEPRGVAAPSVSPLAAAAPAAGQRHVAATAVPGPVAGMGAHAQDVPAGQVSCAGTAAAQLAGACNAPAPEAAVLGDLQQEGPLFPSQSRQIMPSSVLAAASEAVNAAAAVAAAAPSRVATVVPRQAASPHHQPQPTAAAVEVRAMAARPSAVAGGVPSGPHGAAGAAATATAGGTQQQQQQQQRLPVTAPQLQPQPLPLPQQQQQQHQQQQQQEQDALPPTGAKSEEAAPPSKQAAGTGQVQSTASCKPGPRPLAHSKGSSGAPSAGRCRMPGGDAVTDCRSSKAGDEGPRRDPGQSRDCSRSRERSRSGERTRGKASNGSRGRSCSRDRSRSRKRSRSKERSRGRESDMGKASFSRGRSRSREWGRSQGGTTNDRGRSSSGGRRRMYRRSRSRSRSPVGSRKRSDNLGVGRAGSNSCFDSRSRSDCQHGRKPPSRSRDRPRSGTTRPGVAGSNSQDAQHALHSTTAAETAPAGQATTTARPGSPAAGAAAHSRLCNPSMAAHGSVEGAGAVPGEEGPSGPAPQQVEELWQGGGSNAAGVCMPDHDDRHTMAPAAWLQQGAARVCLVLLRSPARKLNAANLMGVLPPGWHQYKDGNTRRTLQAWGWLDGLFELVLEGTVLYITFGPATRLPQQQPALEPGVSAPPLKLLHEGAAALRAAVLSTPARTLPAGLLWDVLPPAFSTYKHLGVHEVLRRWRWMEGLFQLVVQDGAVCIQLGPGGGPTQHRPAQHHSPAAAGGRQLRSVVSAAGPGLRGDVIMSHPSAAPDSLPAGQHSIWRIGSCGEGSAQHDDPAPWGIPPPAAQGSGRGHSQEQGGPCGTVPAEPCGQEGAGAPGAVSDGRPTSPSVWKRLSWDNHAAPSHPTGPSWQTGSLLPGAGSQEWAGWPAAPLAAPAQPVQLRPLSSAGPALVEPPMRWAVLGHDPAPPPLSPQPWAMHQVRPVGASAGTAPAATGQQTGQHDSSVMRRQGDGELSAQPPAALLEQLRCNLRDALKQQACVKVARVGDPGGLLPSGLVRYKSKSRAFHQLLVDWGLSDEFSMHLSREPMGGHRQWVLERK